MSPNPLLGRTLHAKESVDAEVQERETQIKLEENKQLLKERQKTSTDQKEFSTDQDKIVKQQVTFDVKPNKGKQSKKKKKKSPKALRKRHMENIFRTGHQQSDIETQEMSDARKKKEDNETSVQRSETDGNSMEEEQLLKKESTAQLDEKEYNDMEEQGSHDEKTQTRDANHRQKKMAGIEKHLHMEGYSETEVKQSNNDVGLEKENGKKKKQKKKKKTTSEHVITSSRSLSSGSLL